MGYERSRRYLTKGAALVAGVGAAGGLLAATLGFGDANGFGDGASNGFGGPGNGDAAVAVPALYASPTGSGSVCSSSTPCALLTMAARQPLVGNVKGSAATPYRLTTPVALTQAATWQAAPGEFPVISGAYQITGWTLYADAGAGQVWIAPVPPGSDSRQVFVNGNRRPVARYPDLEAAYTPIYPLDAGKTNLIDGGFILAPGDPNAIQTWPAADQVGVEFVGWGDCQMYRVRSLSASDAGIQIGRAHV